MREAYCTFVTLPNLLKRRTRLRWRAIAAFRIGGCRTGRRHAAALPYSARHDDSKWALARVSDEAIRNGLKVRRRRC
jgi:hypothetical protein